MILVVETDATQAVVAAATGLPKDAAKIHNHLPGGGSGHRLEPDGTLLAVRIAQQVDGPVKVVWSRKEDIQHDMYRPYCYDRLSAGLDANGRPVAWPHRIAGSSVMARYVPPLFPRPPSGTASVRPTTSSSSKASWTSWPLQHARISSPIDVCCWVIIPVLSARLEYLQVTSLSQRGSAGGHPPGSIAS
jgi:Molybdopterin-binding domain of aldehyde dehydrogenase